MEMENQKKFQELKDLMKDHWQEDIPDSGDIFKKHSEVFIQILKEYTSNCLYLELLDYKLYISSQMKSPNFSDFYKTEEYNEFPYDFPNLNIDFINNFLSEYEYSTNLFKSDVTLFKNLHKTKFPTTIKENLNKIFEENPILKYYFWNVTFPNIFSGFISNDYCEPAKTFLLQFQEDEDNFIEGCLSFVRHNYYFQDLFISSFFVNIHIYDNSKNDIQQHFVEFVQNSLIRSFSKLAIQQLDILEILFDNQNIAKKAREMFLTNLIIPSIQLWRYSPLIMSNPLIFKDNEEKIIKSLREKLVDDENHEENLNNFFAPIIDEIKKKLTTNLIFLDGLVINEQCNYSMTILDILIISKTLPKNSFSQNYWSKNELKQRLFLKEAFTFYLPLISLTTKNTPKKEKLNIDESTVNKWNEYTSWCNENRKMPLEVIYDDQALKTFVEKNGFDLALYGLKFEYAEFKLYNETKNFLKKESKYLIPLKRLLEAQNNYIDTFSIFYSSFDESNSPEQIKNYNICSISKIIYDILLLTQKDANSNALLLSKTYDTIKDNLTTRYDYFNNNKERAYKLIYELNRLKIDFEKNIGLNPNNNSNVNPIYLEMISISLMFIDHLNKSKLIVYYINNPIKVNLLKKNEIDFLSGSDDFQLDKFENSGVYSYIDTIFYHLETCFLNNSSIPIGYIFAVVPHLNVFLSQIEKCFGSSNNVARFIFAYAFDKIQQKDKDTKIMTAEFISFLIAAYKVINEIHNISLVFEDLLKEFRSLDNFIGFLEFDDADKSS